VLVGFCWVEPLSADARLLPWRHGAGIGYFVRVASIVAITGTLLGLGNSLYWRRGPTRRFLTWSRRWRRSRLPTRFSRRVFYEDFKNAVLYVQDVRSGTCASNWRQVFMADVTIRQSDHYHGGICNRSQRQYQGLMMRLRDGRARDGGRQSQQYNISNLCHHDMRWREPAERVHLGRMETANLCDADERTGQRVHGKNSVLYLIELHNRFGDSHGLPGADAGGRAAGRASRRGGKSSGFVYTILLVFVYYFLTLVGTELGRQTSCPFFWLCGRQPAVCRGGLFLLWQMASGGRVLSTS